MKNDFIQGDAWGTYVALARSAPPERGMAYRTRVPGLRSPRSSRRWRKSTTWRRGTGRRHVKGEGCERHKNLNQVDAVHWRAAWERKTHEPFGGGSLEKYPSRQLAGGLSYRTCRSEGGAPFNGAGDHFKEVTLGQWRKGHATGVAAWQAVGSGACGQKFGFCSPESG